LKTLTTIGGFSDWELDEAGNPVRRWIDRGLGDNHATIANRCQRLATGGLSSNVSARTLVLSPQIEFMQAIPAARRAAVMEELTEATVDRWFEKSFFRSETG
jgi:hypothetical protein